MAEKRRKELETQGQDKKTAQGEKPVGNQRTAQGSRAQGPQAAVAQLLAQRAGQGMQGMAQGAQGMPGMAMMGAGVPGMMPGMAQRGMMAGAPGMQPGMPGMAAQGASMAGGDPRRAQLMQMLAQRRNAQGMQGSAPYGISGTGVESGDPVRPGVQSPVTVERIREARQTLMDYKSAKDRTDQRIIAAQQWWRQRNWEQIREERGTEGTQQRNSASAWLKSSIIGKHADYIESYPEPLFLARNPEDEAEAKHLSEIVPVVLKQIGFESTYDAVGWQKLVEGLGLYAVTWDGQAQHGLGDVSITKVNLLNIYTEPGIEDIQDSANIFCVRMEDDKRLLAQYPQLEGKLGHNSVIPNEYREKEEQANRGKSTVIDWYYKKWANGREVLHYCQFVADEILFASENDPRMAEQGFYQHGQYPFIADGYLPVAGSIYAQGMVDLAKDTQIDIDTMSQAMVTNAVCNATPRYFGRTDGSINEEEFLDWSKPIVHVNGNLGQDTVMRLDVPQMDGNTLNMYQTKVEELKSITGNTEVANGEVPSGVTSGVAIAALKEDAGKTSKDSNKASYRAMSKLYLMVVELIRQFYTMERQFRIVGEDGMMQYISYSNQRMQLQTQMDGYGGVTHRLPLFDVDVHVQRENAYTRMAVNELAIQFFQMGLFNPMAAPQALAMLQMMDFVGKEKMVRIIQQNFMMTMNQMGGVAPAGMPAPQAGAVQGDQRAMPVEDDETESGESTQRASSTPATERMEQRINEAARP